MPRRTDTDNRVAWENEATRKAVRSYRWKGRAWVVASLAAIVLCGVIATLGEDRNARLAKTGVHTDGRVVGVHHGLRYSEGRIDVSFDVNGQPVTEDIHLNSDSPEYRVGDRVEVIYEPGDPSNLMTDVEENDSPWAVFAFAMALLMSVLALPTGLVILWRSRSWRRLMRRHPWRQVAIAHTSIPAGRSVQHLVHVTDGSSVEVLGIASTFRWKPKALAGPEHWIVGELTGAVVVAPDKAGPLFHARKSRWRRRQRRWEDRGFGITRPRS